MLTSAIFVPDTSDSNGTLTVSGSVAGDPNSSYLIQVFANSTADPFGYGQGQTLIGSFDVGINGSGIVSGSLTFTTANLAGEFISATATDNNGNTSEFSNDVIVDSPANIYVNGSYSGDTPGTLVTFPDGSEHEVGFDVFCTVQAALNAVQSGGTINVAAGTCTGSVDITQDVTLAGAGAFQAAIDGAGSGPVITVDSGVTATISGLTITGGTAADGGGIDNAGMLTLCADTISGNMAAGSGGGIENEAGGTLIISDSTISDNTAGGGGGGIDNAGILTLTNTTIADNSAASGGGISDEGTLTAAVNVTIAGGNTSVGTGSGGGLDVTGAGTATLYNTIVAENIDSSGADDIAGNGVTSASSNNLVGADESCTVPISNLLAGANPYLGTLSYNGGPTETIALLANSPAIDAGRNTLADTYGVTTDQRGAVRGGQPDALNAGSTVDIGAYEASASYVVTTTADSYAIGTLRSAILWADAGSTNANPANLAKSATNTIDFDIPPVPNMIEFGIPTGNSPTVLSADIWTIIPGSPLPPVSSSTIINGASQLNGQLPENTPAIMLSGVNAGQGTDGLDLTGNGVSVLSLFIDGFGGDGINVKSNDNTIQDVSIGYDPTYTFAVPNGVGIYVTGAQNLIGTDGKSGTAIDAAEDNAIGWGNMGPGIWIHGQGATGNVVAGDYICCLPEGGGDGVFIDDGASDNWIGVNSVYAPDTSDDGNLIAGYAASGVEISGLGTTGNVVAGNTIESNGTDGVLIDNQASGNWVGVNPLDATEDALQSNNITSNTGAGVELSGASANVVAGNTIESNGTDGVLIDNKASGNSVGVNSVQGSESALQRDVISGNGNDGVEISGMDTTGNVVAGDYIGTDPSGMRPVPNHAGVEIDSEASGNLIGTNGDGIDDQLERNIISGNLFTGVWITGGGTEQNVVAGNYVGTDVSGKNALGNGSTFVYVGAGDINGGVLIDGGASDNLIGTAGRDGSDDADERNVISGNDFSAVVISGEGTSNNVVAGDYLGTTASGEAALGNGSDGDGVVIVNGAGGDWIGVNSAAGPGTENADQGNVISGNQVCGVIVVGPCADNVIAGNLIGTDASGQSALGNLYGVVVGANPNSAYAQDNVIGLPGYGNVISGNGEGVQLYLASGTVLQGNKVGTTSDGRGLIPGDFYDGIEVFDAPDTLIGGTTAGAGNVISLGPFNSAYVPSDYQLTDAVGDFPWGTNGIDVAEFSSSNLGSAGTVIEGNLIGTDVTGAAVLGNPFFGIVLVNVADITVGGTGAGAGNVIAGGSEGGIGILSGSGSDPDDGSSDNLIEGNLIGINFDSNGNPIAGLGNGGTDFPDANQEAGIYINDPTDPAQQSSGNTIGGTTAGAANIIANNYGPGVAVVGGSAFDNPILGNAIYGNTGLGIDLGDDGVTPDHSTPTTGIIAGTPNGDQNFPVLSSAVFTPSSSGSGGTTLISGTLQADTNSTYIVQFFASPVGDPSGYGQGQVLLGSVNVTTDGSGNASFTAAFVTPGLAGDAISATATDPNGNSSEFAQDIMVASSSGTSLVIPVSGSSAATQAAIQAVVSALQSLPAGTVPPGLLLEPASIGQLESVAAAINALAPPPDQSAPMVTVTVDLGGQTYQTDTTLSPPAGVQVVIQNGTLVGESPALTIDSGSVTLLNVTAQTSTNAAAILIYGASLTASGITVSGTTTGVLVENGGAATITDSIISAATGIVVGSEPSDTSTLSAANDSFAGDIVGIASIQTSGSLTATMDWWGSSTGPNNPGNAGGTGGKVTGNVNFSPWLGDAKLTPVDNLVFMSTAGDSFVVAPDSGNTGLGVSLGGNAVGSIAGGATLSFAGTGGTVTIDGESGPDSTDAFTINDTSVQFCASDALGGTTIDFIGSGMTRSVDAEGATNTFDILGAGTGGPTGSLIGDSGINSFVFSGSAKLIGNIQGGGVSTLSYAAYGSGVKVNLGNGTNGTATGVSGTVSGMTALVGSSFNDSLNAATAPGVALSGGLGTNTLSGAGTGDSVVESIASSYTLTNAQLTGTGTSGSFTDNIFGAGITAAALTGSSSTANSFNVSGWTRSGSLSAPAGTGSITASKNAGFTLTNGTLTSIDGMTLELSGITTANLAATGASKTFTVSGWTGSGSLSDTATGTVVASKIAGYTLANASLSSTDGMSLGLVGITTADLTDSGSGGNTFAVTGWTGNAKLSGTSDSVVDSLSASVTLTNALLAVSGQPALSLSGITTANLSDTTGGHTYTVSGWTGSGSLSDIGTTGDTVSAGKSGGFTLANNSLSSTDGMSLSLNGISTANLTDTSSQGGHTFTVTGWTGGGTLKGTAETLVDNVSASLTLTNFSLVVPGLPTLTLSGFTTANLTDTAGGNTFTVGGWTKGGSLTDSATVADTVAASENAGYTLTNASLSSTDGMSLGLVGITIAELAATGASKTFTVSGWTGSGSLSDTATGVVVASKSAGYTLANSSLSSTDGMSLGLVGITTADLTDSGSGGNTFAVTGWTGNAKLSGTSDSVVDSLSASVTLTNALLAVSGQPALSLSGITTANLSDTTGGHTYTVSGWTGSGSLSDIGTTGDTVSAGKSGGFTLANNSLSSTDGMSLSLNGISTANLTDTSSQGGHTFTVTGWTGGGTLKGTAETLVDNVSASLTLTNVSLTVVGLPTLTLNGFTNANLTDTAGGNTFTVGGWTKGGSLTDSATVADTVAASKNASYTLTNASLTSTDGMSLGLVGITIAELAATGASKTFTVSGWMGSGSLSDSATGVVVASKSAGYTLANTSLISTDGMSLGLVGITMANLTDSGSGGNTFAVTGWTGNAKLSGTSDTLVDSVSASVTLTNELLAVSGQPALSLSGIATANLSDTTGGHTFTVSGWTGSGSLADSASIGDTVTVRQSAGYTLTESSLSSTAGMTLGLFGITTANLFATSASETFTVSGWMGGGSLNDTATGIVTASKDAGFSLTNASLSATDGMTLALSGIVTANLTATAVAGGQSAIVDASAFTGVTNLAVDGTLNAILFGGAGNGSTLSATGSGNDVLIGGAGKDALSDTGTGYNILIGGPGVDTLTGNGNDILISDSTSYDRNTNANIAALDAILAEWSSSDSYSLRISKIMSGITVGTSTVGLNATTCQSDGVANTVSDGTASAQNNWFIVNNKDKVTKKSNETQTVV